ncbi:MAG: hypothetical protein Q9196_002649 [Gyalolechia fulgens]
MALGSDSQLVRVPLHSQDTFLADSMQLTLEHTLRPKEGLLGCSFRGKDYHQIYLNQFCPIESELFGDVHDGIVVAEAYAKKTCRKHTIARALATQLGPNVRIVHNHLHIDLAEAILPRSSVDYEDLRRGLREVTLRTLIESEDTWDYIYIFTDFQTSDPLGGTVAEEYRSAALNRRCIFIPIILDCDVEENARRMMSVDRVARGQGMFHSAELLREMRRRGGEIYSFGCPEEMAVDVGGMEADEAAGLIAGHANKMMGQNGED